MTEAKLTKAEAYSRWQEKSRLHEAADLARSEARVKMLKAKKTFELAEQRHQHAEETLFRLSRENMEAFEVWSNVRNQETAAS